MGCASSKDNVQSIEIQDGKVRKKSGKMKIKVISSDENLVDESNAVHVGPKSKSAKSRDSGIGEMDFSRNPDDYITEESDPHLIEDVENEGRPKTPDLSLVGRPFQISSANRLRSKAILEELQAEGLISGTKVEKGGAAFEVSISPRQPLEPLAPIKRPPPRLERLKTESDLKKLPSKQELEDKMKLAEDRRKEKLEQRKSRLASQLTRDKVLAAKLHSNSDIDGTENPAEVGESRNPNFSGLPVHHGQGDGLSRNKTIFDEGSSNDDDLMSPGVTDSTDAFYKELKPSTDSAFS